MTCRTAAIRPRLQPLPTWEQYRAAPEIAQDSIRFQWNCVGHRYTGDGSQAKEAMDLYLRASSERRDQGKLTPIHGGARRVGDDEEYAGEAADRWLSPGGFNLTNEGV